MHAYQNLKVTPLLVSLLTFMAFKTPYKKQTGETFQTEAKCEVHLQ